MSLEGTTVILIQNQLLIQRKPFNILLYFQVKDVNIT